MLGVKFASGFKFFSPPSFPDKHPITVLSKSTNQNKMNAFRQLNGDKYPEKHLLNTLKHLHRSQVLKSLPEEIKKRQLSSRQL